MSMFSFLARVWRAVFNAPDPRPIRPPNQPSSNSEEEIEKYKKEIELYNSQREALKKKHIDTSTTIRRVFYAILSTSLFCIAALYGGKDANIISTSSNVNLPLLNYHLSYTIFLLVGPAVLIGLTAYLHIFIEEHRQIVIDYDDRLSTLFNMDGRSAKVTSWILFYWLPPVTLAFFAWEAWPLRIEGIFLLVITVICTISLLFLQIRRTKKSYKLLISGVSVAISLFALTVFLSMLSEREFNLDGERIIGKDLTLMSMSGASLEEIKLKDVILDGVDLSGADLSGAIVASSEFVHANLTDAVLIDARFSRANLENADLRGATLTNARLMNETRLADALLDGATLRGADLSGALGLKLEQINGACGNDSTQLPGYFVSRNMEFRLKPCDFDATVAGVGRGSFEGQISSSGGKSQHEFKIATSGIYQVDVIAIPSDDSPALDPQITVSGVNLEPPLYDDDSGGDFNSRIIERLEPGDYRLIVEGFGDEEGRYSVNIGPWDRQSIAETSEVRVPQEDEITNEIVVDLNTPSEPLRIAADNIPAWIKLNTLQTGELILNAVTDDTLATDGTEGLGDPLLALFDAAEAYKPTIYDDDSGDGTNARLRCSTEPDEYLLFVASFGDPAEIIVQAELNSASADGPPATCLPQ